MSSYYLCECGYLCPNPDQLKRHKGKDKEFCATWENRQRWEEEE